MDDDDVARPAPHGHRPSLLENVEADDAGSLAWHKLLVAWAPEDYSAATWREHIPETNATIRPKLCNICMTIFHDFALDSWMDQRELKIHPDYLDFNLREFEWTWQRWRPLHISDTELQEGTSIGCFICRVILRSSAYFNSALGITVYRWAPGPRFPSHIVRDLQIAEPQRYLFTDPSGGSGYLYEKLVVLDMAIRPLLRLDLKKEPKGSESLLRLHQESIISPIGSLPALRLAKHWYQDCLENHDHCRQTSQPEYYPTRLLRVQGDMIKLLETSNETLSTPYATLSHCWGTEHFPVLEPSNIQALKIGWRRKAFPLTFQDCFKILDSLQIALIWIDSYCILQGQSQESIDDWRRESVLMEDVYANSIITITAAHGSSPHDGCFSTAAPRAQLDACQMHWRSQTETTAENWVLCDPYVRDSGLEQEHLFSRAWVLQERVLSKRLLHFGASKMYWQCAAQNVLTEDGPFASSESSITPGMLDDNTSGGRRNPDQLQHAWDWLVSAYSRAHLTNVHQDKAVAIHGLASRVATARGSKYTCGMFWKDLPGALTWSSHGVTSRAAQWRAPSWSWLSLDGPVSVWANISTSGLLPHLACIDTLTRDQDFGRMTLLCVGRILTVRKPVFIASENMGHFDFVAYGVEFRFWSDHYGRDPKPPEIEDMTILLIDRSSDIHRILLLSENPDGTFARIGAGDSSTSTLKPHTILLQAIKAQPARVVLLV